MSGDKEFEMVKQYIPVLQKAISATFASGDWKEFGYETNSSDYINGHDRLLRSLSWNDPDYDGCVYDALDHIVRNNAEHFRILIGKDKIKHWIKKSRPDVYSQMYEDSTFVPAFKPHKISPKEAVLIALRDAESSIASGNPVSAVDRVHTALHGYLEAICDEYNLPCAADAGITKLYKIVRDNVIDLESEGQRAEDIKKIMNSLSACVDALNTLRNHASMAHPNDVLLGEAEATLVINTTSTILHYLEAKVH